MSLAFVLGLVQRRIAFTLILFAVMFLVVSVNVRNVYAATLSITPNSVTQGTSFQVSGSAGVLDSVTVTVFSDSVGSCTGDGLSQSAFTSTSGSFGPLTFSSSSLGTGTHCITLLDQSVLVLITYVTVTSPAATIPEYQLSLPILVIFPILAIFIIIGYAVIKRRTRPA